MIERHSLATVGLMLVLGMAFRRIAGSARTADRVGLKPPGHRDANFPARNWCCSVRSRRMQRRPASRTSYDLVVTVIGPHADMVTRRKERKFGIWIIPTTASFSRCRPISHCFFQRPFDAHCFP